MDKVYRAEVVGSMLRPQALKDARLGFYAGEVEEAQVTRLEDDAVVESLRIQEQSGVDVVTDGEMRRFIFTGPLSEAVEGIGPLETPAIHWHRDDRENAAANPIAVTGKLRRRRFLALDEFDFARQHTSKPLKVTLPSPLMIALFWSPEHSTAVYPDPFDAFADGARIIQEEASELITRGCEYIQIDAPELATLVDPAQRAHYESIGISPQRMLTEGVDLLNEIASLGQTKWGIHFCRGNNDGQWMSAGGYEAISGLAFPRAANYDTFLLEYDDHRSGGFEPLRDVPDDKVVVLGLLSTKYDRLEDRAELRRRVDEAATIFPREQLALSTQCGFASGAQGNPIEWDTQLRKLTLVAEVAHEAWPA
jgi:5-methyltetrahydropteroyltriglutamate--homocysteine methyltransferase